MDPSRISPSDGLQQFRCSHCKRVLDMTSPSSVVPCSNCRKVFYCSLSHLKAHLSKHKAADCFPATVRSSPECGRYWVASRDICTDEVIFIDKAIVIGPNVPNVSPLYPTCLGCSRATNTAYRCSKCGWPMCGKKCERLAVHATNECKVFKKNRVPSNCRPQYYFFIQFLRALLLQEKEPKTFAQLMQLESHVPDRRQVKEEVFMVKSFYKFLTEDCNLWHYDLDLVDHVVGANRVNCYSADALIHGKKRFCTAVFPHLSLINHSCNPNTRTIIHEEPGTLTLIMELRACVDIREGQEISQAYITSTKGTLMRQVNLTEDWYFQCKCNRCRDPTELNTSFSAIKCVNCEEGYLLPQNPIEIDSIWLCGQVTLVGHSPRNGCGHTMTGQSVRSLIENIDKEINLAEANSSSLERLMSELISHSLHPNHYLVVNLKFNFLDIFVRKLNYYASGRREKMLDAISEEELVRAAEYAKSILSVTRVICPGRSYCVGVILYFLSCCLIELRERHVPTKFTDSQVQNFIRDAWAILHVESEGSSYQVMVRTLAEKSLVMDMESLSFD